MWTCCLNNTALEVDWKCVRAVVFDLDGTLYRQKYVRFRMALKLFVHVIAHRHGWRDLMVLKHYRENRDRLAEARVENVSILQFKATARAYRLPENQVAGIVHKWMNVKPLCLLRAARYKDIARVFSALRARRVKIGVLSDYPVEDKLVFLGLKADVVCCSTEADVDCLKPEPAGLLKTIEMLGLVPDVCVMIGDRADRDGLCAKSASIPFLLCEGRHFYTRLLADLTRN